MDGEKDELRTSDGDMNIIIIIIIIMLHSTEMKGSG